MDLRQLEYVVAVVDHGGFTRAADALLVAQPSLSQGVRTLEAELGVPLFHRLGRTGRPAGFYVAALAIVYAPVRFLFDFLRKNDIRYGGLTPGQWGALALIVAGVVLLRRAQKKGEAGASPSTV